MKNKPISIEEALKTAITFEKAIHGTYIDALRKTTDANAKKTLEVMAKEEAEHVTFLETRLKEWNESKLITASKLATILPSPQDIRAGLDNVKAKLSRKKEKTDLGDTEETLLLKAIYNAEVEAHRFYTDLVARVDSEPGRDLFRQFLEVEAGHVAMAQAELDAVTGTGFWFDLAEFRLENQ